MPKLRTETELDSEKNLSQAETTDVAAKTDRLKKDNKVRAHTSHTQIILYIDKEEEQHSEYLGISEEFCLSNTHLVSDSVIISEVVSVLLSMDFSEGNF